MTRRRISPISLDDLRTVLAVSEELNFHRAGVKVGLSQTGVTRVVAKVERHVGVRIFERSHNRYQSVSVTDPGCPYIEKVRSVIAQSDHADFAARDSRNGTRHRILIGRSIYTDRRLVEILRSLDVPLYPGLVVDFATKLPVELPLGVRTGELDAAVVSNPGENPFLLPKVIRCVPFTVVLPREHRSAIKESVTLKDLASIPWVLFERSFHPLLYDAFLERARQLGIEIKRLLHVAQAEEACEVAHMVGGATFLSPQGAEHAAKYETLVARPLEEKGLFLKTQILVHRENPSKLVGEFVRAFIGRLTQAGLYQPDLPQSSNGHTKNGHAKNGFAPTSSLLSPSLPFIDREVA
jgi:DNA-binding transcriptional LysR family regulator